MSSFIPCLVVPNGSGPTLYDSTASPLRYATSGRRNPCASSAWLFSILSPNLWPYLTTSDLCFSCVCNISTSCFVLRGIHTTLKALHG